MSLPPELTGKLAIAPDEEEHGYDEVGLVTPLELVTPEDRVAWKEEHLLDLLRDYGMSVEEAATHILFAHNLNPKD